MELYAFYTNRKILEVSSKITYTALVTPNVLFLSLILITNFSLAARSPLDNCMFSFDENLL